MRQKTKREIITEIVEFYSADPKRRAIKESFMPEHMTCEYLTEDGRRCAVGRYLCNPIEDLQDNNKIGLPDSFGFKGIFQDEYKGHQESFWRHLQRFHDSDGNWDKFGLTEEGQRMVKLLYANWAEPVELSEMNSSDIQGPKEETEDETEPELTIAEIA